MYSILVSEDNFFFLVKDLRNHVESVNLKSILLKEMISSSYGTNAISLILRKVKEYYEAKYQKKLVYRLVSSDYSWAY